MKGFRVSSWSSKLVFLAVWGVIHLSLEAQEARIRMADEAVAKPDLARELIKRMEDDQAARQLWIEGMRQGEKASPEQLREELEATAAKVKVIDDRNRAWLAEIIEELGWPGKSLVGERAAHAAWLLVQHADADLEFQEKCLERMKAMPVGEVALVDIAYLTDRVLVAQKRPQIYGTQCREVGGKFEPQECVDPPRLDERRREIGLPPMSEYLQQMEEVYHARQHNPC